MRIAVSCLALLLLAGCGGGSGPEPATPSAPAAEPMPAPVEAEEETKPSLQVLGTRVVKVEDRAIGVAREYTRMFYENEIDALFERFSPEMQQQIPLDQLKQLAQGMREELGVETAVVQEKVETKEAEGYRGVYRWAHFDKYDGVIEVLWILREDDSVAGFFLNPAQSPETP